MKILSQRDKRWSSKLLGNSKLTIGSSGCLITAIAMAAGTTPDRVNDALLKVKGFSGALVVWSNVPKAFPHLKFVWRAYAYDNMAVLGIIKKNGFCMVEATTLFNGKHWLLFIGNHQLYDPWYGTQRTTSSYLRYTGFSAFDKV